MSDKKGSFQPAKLDVDPSILDSNLQIVESSDPLFSSLSESIARPETELSSLMPDPTYPSVTVTPSPGLCVKTKTESGTKFFINLCKLVDIPPPSPMEESELQRMIAEEDYANLWRVPMSLGAPRVVKDKSGVECKAAEVAVNSIWFKKMSESEVFTGFVITVAMEGLADKYGEEARLDRQNWTVLKNKKIMGEENIPAHRIQQRASAGIETVEPGIKSGRKLIEETGLDTKDKNVKEKIVSNTKVTKVLEEKKGKPIESSSRVKREQSEIEPDYKILRDPCEGDVVNRLCVEVMLPGVKGARELTLDLGEDRLVLAATRLGYMLDIFLPYQLDNESCRAEFSFIKQSLNLYIPVVGS